LLRTPIEISLIFTPSAAPPDSPAVYTTLYRPWEPAWMADDGAAAASSAAPSAAAPVAAAVGEPEQQPPLKKRRSAWDQADDAAEGGVSGGGAPAVAPLPGFVPAQQAPAAGASVVQEAPSAPPAASAPPVADLGVIGPPSSQPVAALPGAAGGVAPNVLQPYATAGPGVLAPPTDQQVRTEPVDVPLNAVGLLIGKQGETIKRLQVQSGAMIQVEKTALPGADHKVVHVQGPPDEIRAAKILIQEIIEMAASFQRNDASPRAIGPTPTAAPFQQSGGVLPQGPVGDEVEEIVLVPNKHVGAVIGKGGETIQVLTARSGARIQVRKDAEHNPADPDRPITLIGKKEQVDEARRLVMETVTRAESGQPMETPLGQEYRLPGHIEEHVFIPNDCVGPIIGKSGSTIQMMQQQVIMFHTRTQSLGAGGHQLPPAAMPPRSV
jgi:predicted RNA-binding protein YlqC (UPF0109 family)